MDFGLQLRIGILIIYALFAFFILYQSRGNRTRIKVGVLATAIGAWILCFEMLRIASTAFLIAFWAKTLFIVAPAIIFMLYDFSLELLPVKPKHVKIQNVAYLTILLFVFSQILFTNNLLSGFDPAGKTLVEKAPIGKWFGLCLVFYFVVIFSYMANLVRTYRTSSRNVQMQIIYIFIGTVAALLTAVLVTGVLPVLQINQYVWIGPYSAILIVLALSYAIFKYRLLDIVVVIKKTTMYFALVGIITGLYAFIIMLPQNYVGEPGSPTSIFVMIVAAVIIATTVLPLKNRLDQVTDKIFFQKKYDYYLVLEKTFRELNSVIRLQDVLEIATRPLIGDMHLEFVGIYLGEKQNGPFIYQKVEEIDNRHLPVIVENDSPLTEYLRDTKTILDSGEFRHKYGYLYENGPVLSQAKAEIQRELDERFKCSLILPLVLKNNLIGFMVLGKKLSEEQFTDRDLTLLETLASQMATTLENIKLYERMMANERLTVIGTLAAGIAHEIRNPLASIKTFIQMLPEKYSQGDFRERFHAIVGSEIERLSNITADLLTFARPSAPKLDTVSMDQLMDKVRSLLANQLRKKQVEMIWDLALLPNIQADPQQIFQVFLNITLNAIYASREKSQIKVYGEIKDQMPGHVSGKGLYMLVTVEDFGTGIKRKDLVNLFQPFFTTKTEGTGLGLATCKRILEAHRGDIYIESEEGKGTKVKVMLPTNLTQDTVIIPTLAPIREYS